VSAAVDEAETALERTRYEATMLPLSLLDLTEAVGATGRRFSSGASSKLDNSAPVALTRSALGLTCELLHRFPLLCGLDASLFAGFCFPIERLGYGRGPSNVTEFQHLNFEFPTFITNVEHVAQSYFAGWLGLHSV
jgi:hypothetical protein